MKAGQYQYRDRRQQAPVPRPVDRPYQRRARQLGMKYSTFMNGLKKANIEVDRKVLPIWPCSTSPPLPPGQPGQGPARRLSESIEQKGGASLLFSFSPETAAVADEPHFLLVEAWKISIKSSAKPEGVCRGFPTPMRWKQAKARFLGKTADHRTL